MSRSCNDGDEVRYDYVSACSFAFAVVSAKLQTEYPGISMSATRRDAWTNLTDAQLLDQCEVDTYRASGPGGQKRNKTSSAVRIRHPSSGLIVIAEESRSQHENKAKALKRLRHAFYLKLREEKPTDGWTAHPDFR